MQERKNHAEYCGFYGAETVPETLRALYRMLRRVWCRETCAPRLRGDWSEENPTLGQCSITAFLVQELFGGTVYGVPLPDGNFHCWNEIGAYRFDLTSEQFGAEKLNYENNPVQFKERHLADADKRSRFELLRARFQTLSEKEGLTWKLP